MFIHHILRTHLQSKEIRQAVSFASNYESLVYFAHALEILLHTVVESETEFEVEGRDGDYSTEGGILASVVEFLDHFDAALDVVVGCARKTEMARWRRLFGIVGNPKSLFEVLLFPPSQTPRLKYVDRNV